MSHDTCGECRYYQSFFGEPRGPCFFSPPVAFPSGHTGRPVVRASERECGQFSPRAQDEKVDVAQKTNPDTPGAAIKARRKAQHRARR